LNTTDNALFLNVEAELDVTVGGDLYINNALVVGANGILFQEGGDSATRTNLGLGDAAVEDTTAFAAAVHTHAAADITDLQTDGLAYGLYDPANDAAGATVVDGVLIVNGNHTASLDSALLTDDRAVAFPDANGTLALTSDFAAPPAIGSTTPAAGNFTNVTLKDSTGGEVATFDAQAKLTANRTYDLPDASGTLALTSLIGTPAELVIACSDETTDLTTGTAKVTFRMPYAMTLSSVRASVNTAPTGSTLIVDINEGGSTILSTKLSIDASELTSTTAATAAVISDTALADDAEVTIDIDQIGSTIAGKGLKVVLKGVRA
jgi:hypothetical protein